MGATDKNGGDFASLTDKQAAVLDLLANGRTSKEIASALDLSESAVNRRIELLRTRFSGITRLELARRYRDWAMAKLPSETAPAARVETYRQSLRLAPAPEPGQNPVEDSHDDPLRFGDSLEISIDPPWTAVKLPKVVPGVLDGENAALTRGAAIAIILFGIVASLVLGLAAAGALTAVVGK